MRKSRFIILMFMCIAVGTMGLFVQPAMAARAITIDVNPLTSNGGTTVDITPTVNPTNATYEYTRHDGESVTDTIPVDLCMTAYDASGPPYWTSINVYFGPTAGGNLPGVNLPTGYTFVPVDISQNPDCHKVYIDINTGALSEGNYTATFNFGTSNPLPDNGNGKPNATALDVKNFFIIVTVLPKIEDEVNVSCFLTDSSGLFLTNCSGAWVTKTESDDGRFAIVVNKKHIEVATNPGQFYFNFIWYNSTGSQQFVDVNFLKSEVIPQGANAIHSAIFPGLLSTVDPTVFDEANSNGIPDGSDDQALGILVPPDWSLLVTYHLTWEDLGELVPNGISTDCENPNQFFDITATVSGSGSSIITEESCGTSAGGYKK
jgi:hypothetical protein